MNIYYLASGQNNVSDERKISLLLYQMGRQYTRVFENELTFTTAEDKKNYSYVCNQYKAYFEPKTLTRLYVSNFQRRFQKGNEKVSDFIPPYVISRKCVISEKKRTTFSVYR